MLPSEVVRVSESSVSERSEVRAVRGARSGVKLAGSGVGVGKSEGAEGDGDEVEGAGEVRVE